MKVKQASEDDKVKRKLYQFQIEGLGTIEVYRNIVWSNYELISPRRIYYATWDNDMLRLVVEKDVLFATCGKGPADIIAANVMDGMRANIGDFMVVRQLEVNKTGRKPFGYAIMTVLVDGSFQPIHTDILSFNEAIKSASTLAKESKKHVLPSAATLGLVYVPDELAKQSGFPSDFVAWIRRRKDE